MTFIVEWEQWYRCGRHGDDKDFEIYTREFATEDDARAFKQDLLDGKHRGLRDLKVQPNEIALYMK
jgi:hypothetical protein